MPENRGRIFGGFAALALLWILVYWWWEPARPRISFDAGEPALPRTEPAAPPVREPGPAPLSPRPEPSPPAAAPAQPASPPPDSPPPMAVIPPRFRAYTVKEGDTLDSIARRELGSARLREAISRSNPMVDFERLRPGREIRIPLDPTNIQGKPVEAASAPPLTPPAAPTAPPPEAAVEYTVRSGDTLSRIAKAQYGSVAYKDLIFRANRDRLADEDSLKPGQKLRLPPKP